MPHTIAENLQRLIDAKEDIADAITAKGGTVGANDGLEDFAADIATIPTEPPEPPADGKTRFYISLAEGRLSPVLGLGVNGPVDVDWGDDTAHGTLTGTSVGTLVTISHTYAQGGNYVITLTAATETTMAVFGTNQGAYLLTKDGTVTNESRVYRAALKRAYLGDNVTIIGANAFNNCYGLTSIIVPNNVTIIRTSAFSGCYSLASIVIPAGIDSINSALFNGCWALVSVTLPDSVTTIGDSAIRDCFGLKTIRFKSTTPPTVAAANTFLNLSTDCVIYVPRGTLGDYTSASNYPDSSVYSYVEY